MYFYLFSSCIVKLWSRIKNFSREKTKLWRPFWMYWWAALIWLTLNVMLGVSHSFKLWADYLVVGNRLMACEWALVFFRKCTNLRESTEDRKMQNSSWMRSPGSILLCWSMAGNISLQVAVPGHRVAKLFKVLLSHSILLKLKTCSPLFIGKTHKCVSLCC